MLLMLLVVVVGAAKRAALVSRDPAPAVVVASSARAVARRHLGSQDAGRRARVGVGVASVVHGVGVVVQVGSVTPDR